ncbi:hypothetical protein [Veillonella montpellierensis]|uniref:hypothetical protein n=1 Tax=Veillonella montpellierensis TaxID=187328 RepID=UPI0023F7D682|nr:hypothetical protein [Veillonella montpellierensis]
MSVDGERFYRRKFTSLDAFFKAHQRYASRYNNIVQKVLGFTLPNEYIAEYFSRTSLGVCVTNV